MIYLIKGQKLFENEGMVVFDQTGYYEDDASVLCAMVFAPDEPVCRYEAKFVAYGGMVYAISEPEKLMEEVMKIDPETLFGKTSAERAVDRVIENIETVESETPTTEEATLPEEEVVEPEIVTETQTETATSTPEAISEPEEPVVTLPPESVTLPVIEEVDSPLIETMEANTSTTTTATL